VIRVDAGLQVRPFEVTGMLTKKTILGACWSVSSRLGGRLIDLVTILILARTLTPADFGLTALAMTLISVVDTVLEVPLIQALTRLKDINKQHLDTAFTLGILRGLLLALIVLAAAWPFAIVYDDSRLLPLVASLAIGPIARGLLSPSMSRFIRQMSFRQSFIAEFSGKVIASIFAVSLVYLGAGYWAIAASSITSSVATVLISYIIAPYRPAFSLTKFRDFSTFLGWFSMAQVVSAVSWQFDRAMLGFYATKADLGQYTMASDLSVLPTQSLIGPAMQPVMAAFARINGDPERLRSAYLKASRFTMMLAVPTCLGISLTSDLIVDLLLGPKWSQAQIYLEWLAVATILSAYYQPLYSLALALNQPIIIFRLSMVELLARIILVPLGLHFYSLMGVVGARAAVSLVMFVASLFAAGTLVGLKVVTELANLWRVAAASALMTASVLLLRQFLNELHLNDLLHLGLAASFGSAVYIGALSLIGGHFRDIMATRSDA
jgi:O-antigen/teichoic acid export membrane protein